MHGPLNVKPVHNDTKYHLSRRCNRVGLYTYCSTEGLSNLISLQWYVIHHVKKNLQGGCIHARQKRMKKILYSCPSVTQRTGGHST